MRNVIQVDFSAGLQAFHGGKAEQVHPFSIDLLLIQDKHPLKPKQTTKAKSTYLLTHRDCGHSLSDTVAETEWRTACNSADRWCGHPPLHFVDPVQHGASCDS